MARARWQTIQTITAGTAQSVTALSHWIKHGNRAAIAYPSLMMKTALKVEAFTAVLNLHSLAARRIL